MISYGQINGTSVSFVNNLSWARIWNSKVQGLNTYTSSIFQFLIDSFSNLGRQITCIAFENIQEHKYLQLFGKICVSIFCICENRDRKGLRWEMRARLPSVQWLPEISDSSDPSNLTQYSNSWTTVLLGVLSYKMVWMWKRNPRGIETCTQSGKGTFTIRIESVEARFCPLFSTSYWTIKPVYKWLWKRIKNTWFIDHQSPGNNRACVDYPGNNLSEEICPQHHNTCL